MNVPKKASAIILNTSKPLQVVKNVQSLLQQKTSFSLEIIVVDNSGKQENKNILTKLKQYTNVRIFFPKKNGYSYGNNVGAQHASGDILFIINPDIFLTQQNTLQQMAEYLFQSSEVALLGPKQKNPNGSLEKTARRFPTLFAQLFRRIPFLKNTHLVHEYEFQDIHAEVIQDVDWIQSSFWAVRRDFWEEVGGFDERYFVFMADVEMCRQAHKKGKKVIFYPLVQVEADGIRCSQGNIFQLFSKKILRIHAKDALQYHWNRLINKKI